MRKGLHSQIVVLLPFCQDFLWLLARKHNLEGPSATVSDGRESNCGMAGWASTATPVHGETQALTSLSSTGNPQSSVSQLLLRGCSTLVSGKESDKRVDLREGCLSDPEELTDGLGELARSVVRDTQRSRLQVAVPRCFSSGPILCAETP